MAAAERVLEIARAELGVKEEPAGSNRVKYNTWFYDREVSGASYPWCAVFVQWCFCQAGVLLPARTASCGALMNAAREAGQWVTKDCRPGDVVIYDFPGGGRTDHCGIVEQVRGDGVTSIEGNTSAYGSQSNGGAVCRRTRPYAQIIGAVRPDFREKTDSTPSPAHREGVAWCVEKGILRGNVDGDLMLRQAVTREQLCTMLYRALGGK